jgi:putative ABC transport system permease protein
MTFMRQNSTILVFSPRLGGMFKTALRSLQMHQLRSFLTVLGLVFGVASVIVMLAVAEGASQEAQRQIASLGVKNVVIRSTKPSDTSVGSGQRQLILTYGLTYNDLRRIQEAVPTVKSSAALREYPEELRYGGNTLRGRLVAIQPSYQDSNRLELARGRFLQDTDLRHAANVCVIGENVALKLFQFEDPLGNSVQVGRTGLYRVVGVTQYKTPSAGIGSSLSAEDLNNDVYVPLTTDRSRNGDVIFSVTQGGFNREQLELSQITVQVNSTEEVKATAAVLDSLLKSSHPRGDFSITVPLDLLEQAEATQRIFNIVLGATAAISLLVGGIGIMNIMLASVSERTHEIGIRRALGAKQGDIVLQFLIETATLSLIGTALGLVLGLSSPWAIGWLSGMETKITLWAPLIAAGVSLVVGIGFGVYPAIRAAKLDPIEALRHA